MSDVDAFWERARHALPELPERYTSAWPFGATAEHADELLALVLDGVKTGTASSGWDYAHTGDTEPFVGEFSVILDGAAQPRAVLETTHVETLPFMDVTPEHAFAEGEGDRTLATWRDIHERFWRTYSEGPRGFAPDMPVICERFRVVYAENISS